MNPLPIQRIPLRIPGAPKTIPLAIRSSIPEIHRTDRNRIRDASPAILIHGLGITSYEWRFVQEGLQGVRETIAADLPGSGKSGEADWPDYTLPGQARAALALMDELNIERTTLVGHSLGGGVALLAALLAPERVERLILAGSVAYPQPEPPFLTLPRWPLAWLPLMLFARSFIREGLRQVYLRQETMTAESIREYGDPYRSYRGAVSYQRICRAVRPERLESYYSQYLLMKTPVLILQGDRDNVVPRWVPEKLHAEIVSSEYELLKDAGHMLPEEEPERIRRAILEIV